MATTKKICRTCLKDVSCLSAISEDYLIDGVTLFELLNDLLQLGVRKNDGFPECICQECYGKIVEYKNFKIRAFAAKEAFVFNKDGLINQCKLEDGVSMDEVPVSDDEVQVLTEIPLHMSSRQRSESNLKNWNIQGKWEDGNQDVMFEPQLSLNTLTKTEIKQEYKCDECEMSYPKLALLNQHKKKHEGPFNCIHCGVFFVDKKKYVKHTGLRDPLMPYKPSLPCNICQKRFPCITFLKDHEKIHKETKLSIIRKLKSSNISSGGDPLGGLYLKKLGLRGPAFYCEVCGKRFTCGKLLERHIPHHKEHTKFECDICFQLFKSSRALIAHKEIHVMEQMLNIESHENILISFKNDGQNTIDDLKETKDSDLNEMNSFKSYSNEVPDVADSNTIHSSLRTESKEMSGAGTSVISSPYITCNPRSYKPSTVTSGELKDQNMNDRLANDSDLNRSSNASVTKDQLTVNVNSYNPGKIRQSYSSRTTFEEHDLKRGALKSTWDSSTAGTSIASYNETCSAMQPYYPNVFNGNLGMPNNMSWDKVPVKTWPRNPTVAGQSSLPGSMDGSYEKIKLERRASFSMESVGTYISNPPSKALNTIYAQQQLYKTLIKEDNFSPPFLNQGQMETETGMEQYNPGMSEFNSHPYQASVHFPGIEDLNVAPNPEPQFQCNKCKDKFFFQSNLMRHMKCHHISKTKSSKKRKKRIKKELLPRGSVEPPD